MTWLGFAAPAWLWGFGALAVPWAIHLLSRGRQRRVAIGSVRWLEPAQTLRARRLRLSRGWLLLLRCLLIAALVLALAGPRIGGPAAGEATTWLLVAPEVVAERAQLEPDNPAPYAALDAALAEAGESRWLAPGVPAADRLALPPAIDEMVGATLWSLLWEADQVAPAGAAFVVATTERLGALGGARAALDRSIEWLPVNDGRENRWLERALAVGGDRLAVVVGRSDSAGTEFEAWEVPTANARDGGLEISARAEGWAVVLADGGSLLGDDALVVQRDPAPLAITIFAARDRAQDAHYVRAGLEAAAKAGARSLRLRQEVAGEGIAEPDSAALIFWLAPAPVPLTLKDRLPAGAFLVSDARDRFESCAAALWLPSADRPLGFQRCGPIESGGGGKPAPAAAALWSSAAGRPLLAVERAGSGTWLRFASRFHPEWTDLVLAPQFPAWLLTLVEQLAPPAASARDRLSDRRSAAGQAAPRRAAAPTGDAARNEHPLAAWLWLPAFALAAGERWLASWRSA